MTTLEILCLINIIVTLPMSIIFCFYTLNEIIKEKRKYPYSCNSKITERKK